eukprot:9482388-Pyramimonas_sp.AAC.1
MESQTIIDSIFAEFDTREIKSDDFRYRGLVVQGEDSTASAASKDNLENIKAASYPRDSPITRKCNKGETAQLRPVVGALSWVTRECKPELSYRVSRLQTPVRHAKALHLKEANRALEGAIQSADCGLIFKGGDVKWDQDILVLTVPDASRAGDND